MGRSHDYYCKLSGICWSPFDFKDCPEHGPGDCSEYDLNHELADRDTPLLGPRTDRLAEALRAIEFQTRKAHPDTTALAVNKTARAALEAYSLPVHQLEAEATDDS